MRLPPFARGPTLTRMSDIKYISTRGESDPIGFQDAVMTGLAPDGGLLIPDSIPDIRDRLDMWGTLPYKELAFEVMRLYVDVPDDDLRDLIETSYASFRTPEITPVVPVGDVHMLELFHGPTLAFKDIALQLLGNLFEYILARTGTHLNVLAATSGDTGSAAIYGVRGREHIHIFVMHPHGRVSPTQEHQMTSVLDPNVFNIAVKGTFDDCQNIMKSIFRDVDFKKQYALGAVNSVNWARVLAQIVYYFYAALKLMREKSSATVRVSVPTGNFGDILAGYYACRMGLPISRLVLATNENDILSRFFNTGVYSLGDVVPTLSPSMDIQVASNFERYLFYRVGSDHAKLRELMDGLGETGELSVELGPDAQVDDVIIAGLGDTESTLATIKKYHEQYGYLLDPHTAVGVCVGEQHLAEDEPMICLATAHPAKFGKAILDATGKDLAHHEIIDHLGEAETRCELLPADEQAVRDFIVANAL